MDVILHIGAHRTGTGSLRSYLYRNAELLASRGVGVWRPASVLQTPRSDHRVPMTSMDLGEALTKARSQGLRQFVVSDPDLLGSLSDTVQSGVLYKDAGAQLRQALHVCREQITAVLFSPRSLDTYWCSMLAQGVSLGAEMPCRAQLNAIATGVRGWREVICDIAAVMPGMPLRVLPYEVFRGRPDAFLQAGAGVDAPFDRQRDSFNPSPRLPELRRVLTERGDPASALPFGMGRWNPFTNQELAILRERHADDMMWLTSGAGGLGTLTEDSFRQRAVPNAPGGDAEKGRRDEREERQMA